MYFFLGGGGRTNAVTKNKAGGFQRTAIFILVANVADILVHLPRAMEQDNEPGEAI